MDNILVGGKLIGKGSYGYVYYPGFNCKGKYNKYNKKISKVFFSTDSKKEIKSELYINKIINKIKNNDKWCNIWIKQCKSPSYDILYKQDIDIQETLEYISKTDFNKNSYMLQGTYGGISFTDYIHNYIKPTLSNSVLYKRLLIIIQLMEPLFLGLKELYNNNIIHCDIKSDNITVDSDGCKFIDFGLASKLNNENHFKKRSMSEFISDRIYPSYPYEYIYLFNDKYIMNSELNDYKLNIYRELHDRYINIHETIFKRKQINNYLISLIERIIRDESGFNNEKKKIISLLDTYSLGVLIPSILCIIFNKHKNKLKNLLNNNKIKSFIELFYVMSEPDNYERIDPNEAYRRYLELKLLYLNTNKKTNRQTKYKRNNRRTKHKRNKK